MIHCNMLLLASLVGIVLLVIPYGFYLYERSQNNSFKWSLHKTLLLVGALIVCLGLTWPAVQMMSYYICTL